MSKLFYLTQKATQSLRTLLALVLVLAGTAAARAAEPVDYGELELDKAYEYVVFGSTSGHFTPQTDGSLTVTSTCGDFPHAFSDKELTKEINVEVFRNDLGNPYYELKVEKGVTIYFNVGFAMSAGSFTLSMASAEKGLELKSVTPADGSTLSIGGQPQITFNFNAGVKIGGAEISCSAKTVSVTAKPSGASVVIMPKEDVYKLFTDGSIKAGEKITFRLKNVCMANDESVKYGTDGICEVSYISAAKPVEPIGFSGLLAKDNPFLSYWPKGDERGILKMTFDGDLQPTTEETKASQTVTINYGEVEGEEGEFYIETVPYTVSGKTITCDLTGKLRTPATMVKSGTTYESISVKVNNVRDAQGNYTYSAASGSLGSYSFPLRYQEVKVADITTDFTPRSGSTLKGVKSIELWIQGYSSVSHNGVLFTYLDGTEMKQLVSKDFTLADDTENNAKIMTINVPAEVQGKTNVTVTLNELTVADGRDHSEDFTARYDAFIIESLTYQKDAASVPVPVKGGSFDAFISGGHLELSTNMNDKVGYAYFQIRDLNPDDPNEAIIYTIATLQKDEETGKFSADIYGDAYKLYKGHTYAFEMTAYEKEDDFHYGNAPLGIDAVKFSGTTEPYKLSPIQLVSIDPADGTTIEEQKDIEFTLEFDGMVQLDKATSFVVYGMGSTLPFKELKGEALTPDGFTNVWKITVDAETLGLVGEELSLCVLATDMDGLRVNGNTGKNETSLFIFRYPMTFNVPDVTISPAAESEVESLYKFTVGCAKGINESYNGTEIVLYNRTNHTAVAKVVSFEQIIPEDQMDNWDYNPVEAIITLDKEITEPGSYLLDIPAGYFVLGTQFEQNNSKAMGVSYVIKENGGGNADEPVKVVTVPANGSTVSELSSIVMTFPDEKEVGLSYDGSVMTMTSDQGEKVTLPEPELSFENYNEMTLTLASPVTAKGVYTIDIPAGYLLDSSYSPMKAVTLVYGVGMETGIGSVIVPTESLNSIYTLSGVRVNKQLHELPAGIYIVGGKKVVIK